MHAKRIEVAFAAQMGLPDALPEALMREESPCATINPEPTRFSATVPEAVEVLRRRGRPKKVKAAAEESAASRVPSKPISDDEPAVLTNPQAKATPAKIEKSELAISEPRRLRDKTHLKFVASQPCLVCGRSPSDAHHLRFTQPRAMGRKVSDEFTVPLCRTHHRDNHGSGDEVAWWQRRAIDPMPTSRMLWVTTRRIE